MTKYEHQELLKLARRFKKKADDARKWAKENRHLCGHGNTIDALGDEGWHRLWQSDGVAIQAMTAYKSIKALIGHFRTVATIERNKKKKAKEKWK